MFYSGLKGEKHNPRPVMQDGAPPTTEEIAADLFRLLTQGIAVSPPPELCQMRYDPSIVPGAPVYIDPTKPKPKPKMFPLYEDDPAATRFTEVSGRATMDDIKDEILPHYHLIETHLGEVISDIAYRHFQPATWAQTDIAATWRINSMSVHRIAEPEKKTNDITASLYPLPIYRYEVHSFGGMVARKIEIVSCSCDYFSLESFERWRKEGK